MRRVRASQLAVVLGYVLAASAFAWPLPLHLGTHFTGDPGGDTGVYVWNQWVFHQELTTGTIRSRPKRFSRSPRASISRNTTTPRSSNLLALPLISWLGVVDVVQRRVPARDRAQRR